MAVTNPLPIPEELNLLKLDKLVWDIWLTGSRGNVLLAKDTDLVFNEVKQLIHQATNKARIDTINRFDGIKKRWDEEKPDGTFGDFALAELQGDII